MDDSRRCTARTSGSGYKKRCKNAAIKGGTVCRKHGGAAPQVKRSARRRLLEAAEPAVARLVQILESENEAVAVKAAQLIMDRAGLHPRQTMELTGTGGEAIEVEHKVFPVDRLSLDTRRRLVEDIRSAQIEEAEAAGNGRRPKEEGNGSGQVVEVDGGRIVASRIVDQPTGRPKWLQLPWDD